MRTPRLQITRLAISLLFAATLLVPSLGARPGPVLAQGDSQTFPATGKTASGKFLDYWNGHGGLAQQGYPISDQMQEVSDTDGKTYTVQYFERAVFELHPENQPPNDVLLSLLGSFLYKQRYPNGAPNQTPNNDAGSQLFAATGHRVGGIFLDYWNNHGGLAQQGYPLSDEFQETSDLDGKTYKVQYFERAVFESHPENQPPYNVLLSQLGTFRYKTKYLAPAPTATIAAPTPTAAPTAAAAQIGTVGGRIQLSISDLETISYGAGSLWVAAVRGHSVVRIDPQSISVVHNFDFGANTLCFSVFAADDAVWVTVLKGTVGAPPETMVASLARIDPATNQVVNRFDVGKGTARLAIADGSLWVVGDPDGTVKRIDPKTQKVIASIAVEDPSANGSLGSNLVSLNGEIWVSLRSKELVHIDPTTNKIAERFQIGIAGDFISSLGSSLWVASFSDGKVVRFDLATKQVVATIDASAGPSGLLATQNGVWVSQAYNGQVRRIDPVTNQIVGSLTVMGGGQEYPQQITEANGALWVALDTDGSRSEVVKVVPAP